MEPLTALLVSLLMWVGTARGDLRCYCNEAACISTAYMCKSTSGTCYSTIPYDGRSSTSVHGCVESLPPAERAICQDDGELRPHSGGPQEWPILLCCSDDMCNYSDSLDIKIYVNSKSTTGNSIKGEAPSSRGSSPGGAGDRQEQLNVSSSYSHRLLWFKAAVIAVPIAGGFILILLVLLAVRMLRNDSRRHRQLLQMRHHQGLTKAQLYVADHFTPAEKIGEKHGHWNNIDKHNVVYKDVNVKVDYSSHGYKKMTNSSQHSGSCSSIIVWGKSDKPDPTLTVV